MIVLGIGSGLILCALFRANIFGVNLNEWLEFSRHNKQMTFSDSVWKPISWLHQNCGSGPGFAMFLKAGINFEIIVQV